MAEFKVERDIIIHSDKADVWDALVNPNKIKEYLFGTNTISDWEVGSGISFEGEFQGVKYNDGGIIQELIPQKKLQYTYISSFSQLEDKPENYSLVTYLIEDVSGGVSLKVIQDNIQSEQAKEHTDQNWKMVLEKIKEIAEN